MTQILDKFGLYITHLENVDTDTSYRAKERNRIKGYLKKWKNSKMLGKLCFYLELLKPIMQLSLHFQKEKINSFCCHCSWKSQRKTTEVKKQDVEDFNQIKTMKSILRNLKMVR